MLTIFFAGELLNLDNAPLPFALLRTLACGAMAGSLLLMSFVIGLSKGDVACAALLTLPVEDNAELLFLSQSNTLSIFSGGCIS